MQQSTESPEGEPNVALFVAARDGDVPKLSQHIATRQYDLEQRDIEYGTPLHAAIFNNHVEAVQVLLSAGADPELLAPGEYGDPRDTALMLAARLSRREIAKVLWDHSPARGIRSPEEKMTALELASTFGSGDLVRDFLLWWDGWESEVTASSLWRAASRWNIGAIRALLEKAQFDKDALDAALLKAADMKMIMGSEREMRYTVADFAIQAEIIQLLLDAGAGTNAQQAITGIHAVHIAARNLETVEGLRTLLQKGANANATDSRGDTALFIALAQAPNRRGFGRPRRVPNTEAVKLLLQYGADVDLQGDKGRTPMHMAAYYGPPSLFQLCLEKCGHAWPKTTHGETLLHKAAAGNQAEIVQALLLAGADVNEAASHGWTAIIFAVQSTRSIEDALQIIRLLLDHGVNVNASSESGWTALHRVAYLGEVNPGAVELTELLLSHGADTEALAAVPIDFSRRSDRWSLAGYSVEQAISEQSQIDPGGIVTDQTPLHWAADTGSIAIVRTLLQRGANPSAKDSIGATPAIRAARSIYLTYPAYDVVKRQQVIKLLLEAGASFDEEDSSGMSVRIWAVDSGLSVIWKEW